MRVIRAVVAALAAVILGWVAVSPAVTLIWTDTTGAEHTTLMDATPNTLAGSTTLGSTWNYSASIPGPSITGTLTYKMSITDGYVEDTTPTYDLLTYTHPA